MATEGAPGLGSEKGGEGAVLLRLLGQHLQGRPMVAAQLHE